MAARGYLICCIERTGSNLLAEALAGTGIAGRPLEYFNPVEQNAAWMRAIVGERNLIDGIDRVVKAGTTPNGFFGAKVHWSHFRFLGMLNRGEWNDHQRTAMYRLLRAQLPKLLSQDEASAILYPQFSGLQGHLAAHRFLRDCVPSLEFVWLKRRNMVARAVSHCRAKKTGVWYLETSRKDDARNDDPGSFDLEEIHTLNLIGAFQEEMWQRFFEMEAISPYVLHYEDLVESYKSEVSRVLGFLGIERGDAPIPAPIGLKQSDGISEMWENRYREWSAGVLR